MFRNVAKRMFSPTLSDAASHFYARLEAAGKSNATIAKYRELLGVFVTKQNGFYSVVSISQEDIDRFIADLRKPRQKWKNNPNRPTVYGSLSDSTINGYIQVLKTFFKFCLDRDWIIKSPARHLQKEKVDPFEIIRAMDPEDASKLLNYSRDYWNKTKSLLDFRNYVLVSLLIDSAARDGEVLSIKFDSLDTKPVQVRGGGETFQLQATAGKVGPRKLDISEDMALLLLEYMEVAPVYAHGFLFYGLCRNHETIPTGQCTSCKNIGNPLQTTRKLLTVMGKNAKIEGRCNPHSIRHMVGRLYADEYGIEAAQQKLGHTTPQVTVDHYVPRNRRKAQIATVKLSLLTKLRA